MMFADTVSIPSYFVHSIHNLSGFEVSVQMDWVESNIHHKLFSWWSIMNQYLKLVAS